jgi:hypothetical protein
MHLSGFQKNEATNGIDIYKLKGWDYAGMCEGYGACYSKNQGYTYPLFFMLKK